MKESFAKILLIGMILTAISCSHKKGYKDEYIQYEPIQITQLDKQILTAYIVAKMIVTKLSGWNYHVDAQSGNYHPVRTSFWYALALLDSEEKQYEQRAIDVLEKAIQAQDTLSTSPYCGIWPYYVEEPLDTKKSPVDGNWAEFNSVYLLDVFMYHKDKLPKNLLQKLEFALTLAAKRVQKRNCGSSYTNIAIMGTYVTYMTSHLFNLTEMQDFSRKKLKELYEYTMRKGGFTEYNSPEYTLIAMNELARMQRNIIQPDDRKMIDKMYDMCWDVTARHYHKPTRQWAGPHSRSYRTIVDEGYYGLLKKASDGKLDFGYSIDEWQWEWDVKIKNHIPEQYMKYYLSPEYPRTEVDVFENEDPKVIGTTYLTERYALGSVTRSSFWNQRRPIVMYWGEVGNTRYLQVRFLRNDYDFCNAAIYTEQDKNNILAAVNLNTNGGYKHPHDRVKDGKFPANDLRIRFEFGRCSTCEVHLPKDISSDFEVHADGMKFKIKMLYSKLGNQRFRWEKGNDDKASWVDFVIYHGEEKEFDMINVDEVNFDFVLSVGLESDTLNLTGAGTKKDGGIRKAFWNDLHVETPMKPTSQPEHISP